MKNRLVIIILFAITILLLIIVPKDNYYIKKSRLYISEIMASNKNTIQNEYGDYSDYIELYNGNRFGIDLSNFHLSDSEYNTSKWTFPKGTVIKPHSYLLIFCDGLDNCDKYCHTNFKLSSLGEVIILSDNVGNIISKVPYETMDSDISLGFNKNKYELFLGGTPGKPNKGELYKISDIASVNIKINEYMTRNKVSIDEKGFYNDWVEIYNKSDQDVVLKNLYISDTSTNLKKHKLDDISIKKNGYYVIEFNDKVGFKISDGESIILSNGKNIIDKVEVVKLTNNMSYGLKDDKWYYFSSPTKGKKNDTAIIKEEVVNNERP